jgi:biopolymer transport protein ExbD
MQPSILRKQKQHSPILSLKRINPDQASGNKKSLFFSLNLTTLIDAFCILVIFLLSNMNGRVQNLQTDKVTLPTAAQTESLSDGLVVRLEKDTIFIDDKAIAEKNVVETLMKSYQKEKRPLVIQADKKSNYESIAFIMRAGGQAGFEKYVFAVLPGT